MKIIEVKSKRDIKRFINFPLELYKDSLYYVPMLQMDEKKIFQKNYVYNNTCETVFYLCVDDNDKVLGRIEGIIQKAANEKWNQKRVRFTRFDAINDQDVANALFDAVTEWAKPFGIEEIVGPLGYSDLEREGLLIEGFDRIQTYEEQYNYEYYQHLIDNYGFKKDVDWLEYNLYCPKSVDPKVDALVERIQEKYSLRIYHPKNVRKFIKQYRDEFFELIDTTYNKIYGTVPFTEEMMQSSISNFSLILRPQDITVIFNKENKIVAFALMFPSISKVVTKYKGKIGLGFLIDFFKNKKNPEILDLGLIGVLPEYANKGAISIILQNLFHDLIEHPVKHIETNLMLEENHNILNLMNNLEHDLVKRRRCYIKKIK